jgi:hypothetical protein
MAYRKNITPENDARGEYLGTDAHGFTYYLRADLYVYQYNPAGVCRGWISHVTAWDNAISAILVGEVTA